VSRVCGLRERSFILFVRLTHEIHDRGAVTADVEAHVPAEPPSPLEDTRVSAPHENQERTGGTVAPAREGTQTRLGKARVPRIDRQPTLHLTMTEVDDQPSRTQSRACWSRAHRLLKHSDFERVYRQGRRHFAAHLTVFFIGRESGTGPRVGFTVSRALGGSVERNRIRRRLREAVRLNLKSLHAPVDVVINPKKSAVSADFAQLGTEVLEAFQKIESSGARMAGAPRPGQS
jgi:ribonuclease P protein component